MFMLKMEKVSVLCEYHLIYHQVKSVTSTSRGWKRGDKCMDIRMSDKDLDWSRDTSTRNSRFFLIQWISVLMYFLSCSYGHTLCIEWNTSTYLFVFESFECFFVSSGCLKLNFGFFFENLEQPVFQTVNLQYTVAASARRPSSPPHTKTSAAATSNFCTENSILTHLPLQLSFIFTWWFDFSSLWKNHSIYTKYFRCCHTQTRKERKKKGNQTRWLIHISVLFILNTQTHTLLILLTYAVVVVYTHM